MANPEALCLKKWTDGVMEYWNIGNGYEGPLIPIPQYSVTPTLQFYH
jgi:hypothetical protein